MKSHACRSLGRMRVASIALLYIGLILAGRLMGGEALAHGGKTHSEAFTALQALQKATELFDKLVVSGKLEESWETALEKVEVAVRDHQDAREYRVGFHRGLGDPTAVYIFLNAKGEYSGSNFDGKW